MVNLLFYLLILVALYLVGQNIIGQAGGLIDEPLMFFIVAILLGFVFNVVLFELGHMLGAKLGGYKVYSVSFLGLTIYKDEKKTKVVYDGTYDGFTGETKIYPIKEKTNVNLYCWMGSLFLLADRKARQGHNR